MDAGSSWTQKSTLEKQLILLIVVSTAVAIGFLVALLINLSNNTQETPKYRRLFSWSPMPRTFISDRDDGIKICNTPSCVHTASNILLNMDVQFDPCEDFYDFACGSFEKNTRIPDDMGTVSTISMVTNQLQERVRMLLEEPIRLEEPKPFMLAKTLYEACMNQDVIEARGIQPLLDMLQHLGDWPVLDGDEWDDTTFSWEQLVYKCRSAGYSDYFLDFSIISDAKNSTKRIIALHQPSLGLIMDYLNKGIDNKLVQSYYEYMVDIAVLLGANRTRAKYELQDSLHFEINLAGISLPLGNLYNPMTISEIQRKYPSISWLDYINRLLDPYIQVGPDEIVTVNVPKYVRYLTLLLEKTSKRTLANYVMWRVVSDTVPYLTSDLLQRRLALDNALYGEIGLASRWKKCANTVSSLKYGMPIAVGALYVRKYFNEHSKSTVLEMVNDLRQQFRKILTNVNWMDSDTKKLALKKADMMTEHIAYPNELLDDKKLTEYYQGLEISSDKFMESVLNLSLFKRKYLFGKLHDPVNKTDWRTYGNCANVNTRYSETDNSIEVPAGALQGVIFSHDRPAYMNYGAIGTIIGHEIIYGFDKIGSEYDTNGNIYDWWKENDKKMFLEKAQCIIDQYSKYTVAQVGKKLNGILTQGENIADNGGIKQAYYGYQAWIQRQGEEARLPGLEQFTPNQMFWLSAANMFCAVSRDEYIQRILVSNFHGVERFRVVGSLSNLKEFSHDYMCPEGSHMNPVKKCKFW